MHHPEDKPISDQAARTVGTAIQRMAAARLGRAFVPLAGLFLAGVVRAVGDGTGIVLAVGAPLTAGAMLAFGMRSVQQAFGRPRRGWMVAANLAVVVPPAYGLWVLGWLGLRALAGGGGILTVGTALLYAGLGGWVLWSWLRLLELGRLADTMGGMAAVLLLAAGSATALPVHPDVRPVTPGTYLDATPAGTRTDQGCPPG